MQATGTRVLISGGYDCVQILFRMPCFNEIQINIFVIKCANLLDQSCADLSCSEKNNLSYTIMFIIGAHAF